MAYCVLRRENAVLLFRWLLGLVGGYGAYMVSLCIQCGESTHFV